MIKAEITAIAETSKVHIITELNGDFATLMVEIREFLNVALKDLQKAGKSKEHLLALLYQMTLKKWSKENEND